MPQVPASHTDSALPEALAIAEPLVSWLIQSGIGYGEFVAALKPVFLARATEALLAQGHKPTDSALSLRSGLHRKDVRLLKASAAASLDQVREDGGKWGKPSLANQVVTRWLSQKALPDSLPLMGSSPCFEDLVRSVSTDVHPRAVLMELLRLGVVFEHEGGVQLRREAFVPDAKLHEARQLLAGSVADHLQAGVHNLTQDNGSKFLEQSVFADGLSAESVQHLNLLANQLWAQAMAEMVAAATTLCEQDNQHPQPHRFRMGLFTYAAPEFGDVKDEKSHENF